MLTPETYTIKKGNRISLRYRIVLKRGDQIVLDQEDVEGVHAVLGEILKKKQ